jgi:hypothetical protein
MLYLIAVLVPPLAVFLCGKPFQALLNGILWAFGVILALVFVGWPLWLACTIHAVGVVHNYYADQRSHRVFR